MSLGFVVKVPEGLVLAVESRITLGAKDKQGNKLFESTYDNATKLLSFSPPHNFIGVVTYGQAVIGGRTAQGYQIELERQLPKGRDSVEAVATDISNFFKQQYENSEKPPGKPIDMEFLVAGYNENEIHGRIYQFKIPNSPKPEELHPGVFGAAYGGDLTVVSRLIHGIDVNLKQAIEPVKTPADKDEVESENKVEIGETLTDECKASLLSEIQKVWMPVLFPALPLQDAVDFAVFNIRTTIDAQRFALWPHSCGGPIDVCTITRADGLVYVKQKQIKVG